MGLWYKEGKVLAGRCSQAFPDLEVRYNTNKTGGVRWYSVVDKLTGKTLATDFKHKEQAQEWKDRHLGLSHLACSTRWSCP